MAKAMYADIWEDLFFGPRAQHSREAMKATGKVAAHQFEKGIAPAKGTQAHDHALGNDWADTEAKAARQAEHPGWAPADMAVMHLQVADARATLELAMVALKRWPRTGQLEKHDDDGQETRRQRRAAQAAQRLQLSRFKQAEERTRIKRIRATHQWCTWNHTKRCAQCLVLDTKEIASCTGSHPLRELVAQAQDKGHQVWAAAITGVDSTEVCCPMAVCKRCGGYTFGSRQAKGLKLLSHCEPPTKVGATAWGRIAAGKHPKADKVYKACRVVSLAPWPFEPLVLASESAAADPNPEQL